MTNVTSLDLGREEAETSGLFRHLASMVRRYSRDPETRATSARHAVVAALNLYARHASTGEAAIAAAETIAQMAQIERGR